MLLPSLPKEHLAAVDIFLDSCGWEEQPQYPLVVILRGIPGSGKRTLAERVRVRAEELGRRTMMFPVDEISFVEDSSKLADARRCCCVNFKAALEEEKQAYVRWTRKEGQEEQGCGARPCSSALKGRERLANVFIVVDSHAERRDYEYFEDAARFIFGAPEDLSRSGHIYNGHSGHADHGKDITFGYRLRVVELTLPVVPFVSWKHGDKPPRAVRLCADRYNSNTSTTPRGKSSRGSGGSGGGSDGGGTDNDRTETGRWTDMLSDVVVGIANRASSSLSLSSASSSTRIRKDVILATCLSQWRRWESDERAWLVPAGGFENAYRETRIRAASVAAAVAVACLDTEDQAGLNDRQARELGEQMKGGNLMASTSTSDLDGHRDVESRQSKNGCFNGRARSHCASHSTSISK